MPRTAEDVENYLLQLAPHFENDKGTFLLHRHGGTIAVRVAPPIVAVRVQIGPVPADDAHKLRLFEKLLRYNATDLMHISYGCDGEAVVLSGALELENLDLNEMEAMLSDIDLALMSHVPSLREAAST